MFTCYLKKNVFFALNGKVPKRCNIYTNKLRNLEYLQVPKENVSSKDWFKFGLLINTKFPKYKVVVEL